MTFQESITFLASYCGQGDSSDADLLYQQLEFLCRVQITMYSQTECPGAKATLIVPL